MTPFDGFGSNNECTDNACKVPKKNEKKEILGPVPTVDELNSDLNQQVDNLVSDELSMGNIDEEEADRLRSMDPQEASDILLARFKAEEERDRADEERREREAADQLLEDLSELV